MYSPEKDPVLNAAERRLYVVVDHAIDLLARVTPEEILQPVELIQPNEPIQKLPQGVVSLNAFREQRDQAAVGEQQEAINRSRADADEAYKNAA